MSTIQAFSVAKPILRRDRDSEKVNAGLVVQNAVVHQFRDLEPHVQPDLLIIAAQLGKLGIKANFAGLRVEEWLIIDHSRKDEYCPHPVPARRSVLLQEHALATLDVKIRVEFHRARQAT